MPTAIVTVSTLHNKAKQIAAHAIESVHLSYYEKGGIRDTADTLKTQVDSSGKHVFTIARYAAKQHPEDITSARRLYLTMCEFAESEYKTQHNVDNLREALPTWATVKSNVLRGLRIGLNPTEFRSEKTFRSKTMERISRKRSTSDAGDSAPRAGPALRSEEEIDSFMATTVVPQSLKQLITQVVFAAEVVLPSRIEQAEEILREAWQKLGSLTDKRKLRSG
jgi:hypothetical protein